MSNFLCTAASRKVVLKKQAEAYKGVGVVQHLPKGTRAMPRAPDGDVPGPLACSRVVIIFVALWPACVSSVCFRCQSRLRLTRLRLLLRNPSGGPGFDPFYAFISVTGEGMKCAATQKFAGVHSQDAISMKHHSVASYCPNRQLGRFKTAEDAAKAWCA